MSKEANKQFLTEVISKIKYRDFKFNFDSICVPTDEQLNWIESGGSHTLKLSVVHWGADTDKGKEDEYHWMTHFSDEKINEWTEKAIVKACFISLIKKLRHEASELFNYNDEILFHEHKVERIEIPK